MEGILNQILEELKDVRHEVSEVKQDLGNVRQDVNELKRGQQRLESKQDRFEAGQERLESKQDRFESNQERLESKVDSLISELRSNFKNTNARCCHRHLAFLMVPKSNIPCLGILFKFIFLPIYLFYLFDGIWKALNKILFLL